MNHNVEKSNLSKDDWIKFINFQISLGEQKRNRYGYTFWVLVVSLVMVGQKLFDTIYTIEATPENIKAVRSISIVILLWVLYLYIRLLDIKVYSHQVINRRTVDTRKNIVLLILNCILFFYAGYMTSVQIRDSIIRNEYLIFSLIILTMLTTTFRFILYKVPLEPDYFFRKRSLSDNITVHILKRKDFFPAINSIAWFSLACFVTMSVYIPVYTSDIVLCAILINISIILFLAILNLAIKQIEPSIYDQLLNEVFLSNMSSQDIKQYIEDNIIGKSTLSWLLEVIDKIDKLESKIMECKDENDTSAIINERNALIENLRNYYKCTDFSFIEDKIYRNYMLRIKNIEKTLTKE